MKIFETELKAQEVLKDVVCDHCGKSCTDHPDFGPEFMLLKSSWGYNSRKDLETWEAHLCEECVDNYLSFIEFNKTSSISGKKLPR